MGVAARGVVGPGFAGAISPAGSRKGAGKRNGLGRPATAGESPVRGSLVPAYPVPEYRRTREIRREPGGTTLQG